MELPTFEAVIYYASVVANDLLALLCTWGLIAFFPRKATRGQSAASWLILAIWLGFLAITLRTYHAAITGHYVPLDIVWNALGAASIYLHFYARFRSIPEEDQKIWSPLLMGFYPDLSHWAVKTVMKMQALYRNH